MRLFFVAAILLFRNQPQVYDPLADRLYRCYLGATVIGVIGGFIGIGILIWQAVLTRNSANAARDAAIAAKTNSQAVINSERPWMFIEIQTNEAKGTDVTEHLGFSVTFKNWGKTPAEIISFQDHPTFFDNIESIPNEPAYSLEGHVWAHTRMVPAGEIWRDPGCSYWWAESLLPPDVWQEIRRSRKRLVYWGRLQYRDLLEESRTIFDVKQRPLTIHETCFCYFWSPAMNEFLICGPMGYNKHT